MIRRDLLKAVCLDLLHIQDKYCVAAVLRLKIQSRYIGGDFRELIGLPSTRMK